MTGTTHSLAVIRGKCTVDTTFFKKTYFLKKERDTVRSISLLEVNFFSLAVLKAEFPITCFNRIGIIPELQTN